MLRSRRALLAAALSLAALAGCEGTHITEPGPPVSSVIQSVSIANGAAGSLREGKVPTISSGATFSVTAPPAAVVGGTALYTLTSSAPFTQAFVTIDGYDGYFAVDLPAPASSVDLLVTFKQEQLYFDYVLAFNGAATGGGQGTTAFARTHLLSVGTGDVQVSVFFDSLADVDLHVFDPNGDHVYFGNRTVASGGTLDLDANAACRIDTPVKNNENITFPTGTAPHGTYKVQVNYWSNCNVTRTRYVVTVSAKGQATRTFVGQFGGASDVGVFKDVVTFTY